MLDQVTPEQRTEIRPLTRQARRHLVNGPCARCGDPLTPDAVFDDYPGGRTRISHRSCAERVNAWVDQINREAAEKRLEDVGFEIVRPSLARL